MTLADIILEVRQICQQTDAANSQASDSSITGWANECTSQLCSILGALPKETFDSVVAADTITLDTDLLRIDYAALYDGNIYHTLNTIDFPTFAKENPDYPNTPAGQPYLLVRMTNANWEMYPKPDTTWTGRALKLVGSAVPTAMVNTTDVPPFSQVLHPAYPHYCAWKFFMLLNDPIRAANEYSIFDSIRKSNQFTATNTRGTILQLKV